MSVLDLRPNPQDTSAFYLANVYQVLADPNVTRPPTSIPSPVQPPPLSPPRHAVWVNSLWFLSFVINLTGALLATSLHQWARRYIRVTQPSRCSPEKRARRRAFFAGGVDKLQVRWAVEALPALIHLSLFLFFRPRHFSFQYQSQRLPLRDLVDVALCKCVWMRHIHANVSARQPVLYAAFYTGHRHFCQYPNCHHQWSPRHHFPFRPDCIGLLYHLC